MLYEPVEMNRVNYKCNTIEVFEKLAGALRTELG